LLVSAESYAAPFCTLLADAPSGRIVYSQGTCDERVTPASTFKLPISVMGFDAGILTSAHAPAWPYREEYKAWHKEWKKTHDPTSWLRESVVWYSQVITRTLGRKGFQHYVDAFGYGNRDVSGNRGFDDGLTNAWLSSSLQISPYEQMTFLHKLFLRKLPASPQAQDLTIGIMPAFTLDDGWMLQGKTGTGSQQDANGKPDDDRQIGWFIGYASKGGRQLIFVRLIDDDAKIDSPAGPRARDAFLAELPELLKKSEPLRHGASAGESALGDRFSARSRQPSKGGV
jgi:beta-lactamase class D